MDSSFIPQAAAGLQVLATAVLAAFTVFVHWIVLYLAALMAAYAETDEVRICIYPCERDFSPDVWTFVLLLPEIRRRAGFGFATSFRGGKTSRGKITAARRPHDARTTRAGARPSG